MNARWTRDEVILGLDVLFSTGGKNLSQESEAIVELSDLLNSLPLIPPSERGETFRNPAGVSSQLSRFQWSLNLNDRRARVNSLFYIVYDEFKDDMLLLSRIAASIRRNRSFVVQNVISTFSFPEETFFQEGILLYTLHRYLEHHWGVRFSKEHPHCSLCAINPESVYILGDDAMFLEPHLLTPPQDMEPEMRFSENDFVIVCPNCHKFLHLLRPWRSRPRCEHVFQTLG
ncbi:MAG: hypothetical protein EOM12_06890 [Verrucomicrobiae bacterium]|nr:hypothetical protein [Bacteroidia bacterium]NCC60657.1 hypothetical protein [Verrucomicrobiae bacterium]